MTKSNRAGKAARRALATLREEGLRSFWFKLASALGYRRLLLLERSLTPTVARLDARPPLRFDILMPSEIDDHLAFRPEVKRADVLERLRSGQWCFIARHEGRIVSTCWATTQPARIDYLACVMALAAGDVYLFDAFTLPAYRGQGVAPALCGHQLAHFRGLGLRRAIRATLPENVPALRAHAKNGFRPFATIRSLGLGPWHCTFQRPLRRHGSFSMW